MAFTFVIYKLSNIYSLLSILFIIETQAIFLIAFPLTLVHILFVAINTKALSNVSGKHAHINEGQIYMSILPLHFFILLDSLTMFHIVHPLTLIAVTYSIVVKVAFTLSYSHYKVASVTEIQCKVLTETKAMEFAFVPLACISIHAIMGDHLSKTMAQTFFKIAFINRTIAIIIMSLAMLLILF